MKPYFIGYRLIVLEVYFIVVVVVVVVFVDDVHVWEGLITN